RLHHLHDHILGQLAKFFVVIDARLDGGEGALDLVLGDERQGVHLVISIYRDCRADRWANPKIEHFLMRYPSHDEPPGLVKLWWGQPRKAGPRASRRRWWAAELQPGSA